MQRIKSVAVAVVALGLSAGAVFASQALPAASNAGITLASHVSGQPVPNDGANANTNGHERSDEDGDTPTPAAAAATPEADATVHPDNHGKIVSEAAHGSPPAANASQYRNHGAWVSSVAHSGKSTGQVSPDHPKPTHSPDESGND